MEPGAFFVVVLFRRGCARHRMTPVFVGNSSKSQKESDLVGPPTALQKPKSVVPSEAKDKSQGNLGTIQAKPRAKGPPSPVKSKVTSRYTHRVLLVWNPPEGEAAARNQKVQCVVG